MTRTYLVRGMLVGLFASVLAFGFAKTVGEPQVAKAEAFEKQLAAAHHDAGNDEIVSRGVQDTVGLGLGLLVAGTALGGIFGLTFTFAYQRVTRRPARSTAALLGAGAFVTVYLVPFLKYPANPPSVGDPDTIGRRTTLYLLLIAMSMLAAILAAMARNRLRPVLGGWNASIAASAVFCALVTVFYVAMPGVNEVPAGFPNAVLWKFRLASLGIQLLLWMVIGLAFGFLTERAELRRRNPALAA